MQLLTINQVAEIVGLSSWTVRRAIHDGELPASKLRSRYLVDAADLDVWVQGGRVSPSPKPEITHIPVTPSVPYPAGANFRDRLRRERAG